MRARHYWLLSVLALAVSACLAPPRPKHQFEFPESDRDYAKHVNFDGRKSPAQRQRFFESRYRDVAYNFRQQHPGLDALGYPATHQLGAAWNLLALGHDYMEAGDESAAAHAFWAALGQSGQTIGSRPDREKIRQQAYLGLREVALERGHEQWAELLGLLADFGQVYLDSHDAETSHQSFYSEIRRLRDAKRQADLAARRAQQAIDRQATATAIQAQLNQLNNTVANAYGDGVSQQELQRQTAEIQQAASAINQQQAELNETQRAARQQLEQGTRSFRQVVASDIPEIQAGRTFVGNEIAYYLASTEFPGDYVDVVARYAKDRRHLDSAMAKLEERKFESDLGDAIVELAASIGAVETYVALFERRSKKPSPKYLKTTCTTGSDADCKVAGEMLCRGGVGRACGMLGEIMASKPLQQRAPRLEVWAFQKGCQLSDARSCAEVGEEPNSANPHLPEPSSWITEAWAKCRRGLKFECRTVADTYREDSPALAARFDAIACEANGHESCYYYGRALLEGRGVKRDPAAAIGPLQKACNMSWMDSCDRLADAAEQAPDSDPRMTASVLETSCQRGSSSSCLRAANLYRRSPALASQRGRADNLYFNACMNDQTKACLSGAKFLVERAGQSGPPENARQMLERACAAGEAEACSLVARLLDDGTFEAEEGAAKQWLERACKLGEEDACQ
jgi:TPR repeat protein